MVVPLWPAYSSARCLPVNQRIDICDGDPDKDRPVGPAFTVLQLVEVAGIVVVDRRPQEAAQVFGIVGNFLELLFLYQADLVHHRGRVPGHKAVFFHCMPGNGFQVNIADMAGRMVLVTVSARPAVVCPHFDRRGVRYETLNTSPKRCGIFP
jgi:hypothetical protein